MRFETMDCRDLKYENESFDLIIDKSTIDAMLCSECDSLNVAIMLKECQRTLKTGGYYVAISYGAPSSREFLFMQKHLKFYLKSFQITRHNENTGHPSRNFMYILKKREGANERCFAKWPKVL